MLLLLMVMLMLPMSLLTLQQLLLLAAAGYRADSAAVEEIEAGVISDVIADAAYVHEEDIRKCSTKQSSDD